MSRERILANKRKRRERAKQRGFCGICVSRRAAPGYKSCEVCLERARTSPYMRRRAEGARTWCMECLAFGFHRLDCRRVKETQ